MIDDWTLAELKKQVGNETKTINESLESIRISSKWIPYHISKIECSVEFKTLIQAVIFLRQKREKTAANAVCAYIRMRSNKVCNDIERSASKKSKFKDKRQTTPT